MTKAEVVDLALLNLLGGKLTADANVYRVDLEAFLPAVVAEAMKMEAYERRAEARAELAVNGFKTVFPPLEFYKEVGVTPIKDTVSCKYYAILPALVDLPNGWNVMAVRPGASFDTDFIRLNSFQEFLGAEDIPQPFFWVSNSASGVTAYFANMPLPVQNIVFMLAVSPTALEDDERLPLPLSVEYKIVPMLEAYFRRQRMTPADALLDHADVNEQQLQTRR